MDFEKARYNMVEQQVRPWDVLDDRVLDTINTVPREHFTPEAYKNLAYADTSIPLGEHDGEDCRMLHPVVEGRILQHLQITPDCTVLEIGTGTGYLAACMAKLGNHVDTVSHHETLCEQASSNLETLGVTNVSCLEEEDLNKPAYDAIAITSSMPGMPEKYKKLLKIGGRLFVIVGEAPAMTAYLVTRTGKDQWDTEELFETSIEAKAKSKKAEAFVF